MIRRLVLVLTGWAIVLTATSMRRVAQIPSGPYSDAYGRVVCCDSDHDSMPELVFATGMAHPSELQRLEVWEHQGWNRFRLVLADTGAYPPPPGITIGNAMPFAAGDVDGDGLTDIVCITVEPDSSDPDTVYDDVITVESPDSFSYPRSVSWYYRCGNNFAIPFATFYPPDMDNDGHKEIISATPSLGLCFWENTGNNQNELVWRDTTHAFSCMTFGDFDMDGKMNFASASAGSDGITSVWECTGDDQYRIVYQDTVLQPNGDDAFMTNDIDGDGRPEFYVAFENVPRSKIYLYMWEADQVGSDVYHRTLVDSVSFSGTDWGRISECGDIDADGIDECIWTTPDVIKVYKAVGDDNLQEVWRWYSDHGSMQSLVSTVYDVNNDGYKELITAGNNKISIFEVDAVDLVSPTHGSYKVGDTVPIRWATHSPPRCDSLSLFLRRDSSWLLDTIARGLPGTDTLYHWVVPSGVPDTGRIVVMAYGPGHQYDVSDSVISFIGGGVAEVTSRVYVTRLRGCSPNPFAKGTSVNYELAQYGRVELTVHDVSGRLVRRLESGPRQAGFHTARWDGTDGRGRLVPSGVYFVRFSADGNVSTGRLTLVR